MLGLIGQAEMEKEIQKTVTEIVESRDILDINKEREIELDEKERYEKIHRYSNKGSKERRKIA